MRVELLPENERGTVQFRTVDAPAAAPEWLAINPNAPAHKIVGLPVGHFFDGNPGQRGAAAELLVTAERFLAGGIDRADAERRLAATLDRWCAAGTEPGPDQDG